MVGCSQSGPRDCCSRHLLDWQHSTPPMPGPFRAPRGPGPSSSRLAQFSAASPRFTAAPGLPLCLPCPRATQPPPFVSRAHNWRGGSTSKVRCPRHGVCPPPPRRRGGASVQLCAGNQPSTSPAPSSANAAAARHAPPSGNAQPPPQQQPGLRQPEASRGLARSRKALVSAGLQRSGTHLCRATEVSPARLDPAGGMALDVARTL